MRYIFFTLLCFAVVTANLIAAEQIEDFINKVGVSDGSKWLSFETDLDGDSVPELWLSKDRWRDGAAGNMWQVFVFKDDAYSSLGDIVSIRKDTLYLRQLDENDTSSVKKKIVTYYPAGGGRGRVVALLLERAKLQKVDLGDIAENAEDDAYQKYFQDNLMLKPVSVSANELKDRVHQLETSQIARQESASGIPQTTPVEEVAESIEGIATYEPTNEEPAEVAPVEVAEETPEKPSQWWLWLIGAVVIIGGLGLVLRRKS